MVVRNPYNPDRCHTPRDREVEERCAEAWEEGYTAAATDRSPREASLSPIDQALLQAELALFEIRRSRDQPKLAAEACRNLAILLGTIAEQIEDSGPLEITAVHNHDTPLPVYVDTKAAIAAFVADDGDEYFDAGDDLLGVEYWHAPGEINGRAAEIRYQFPYEALNQPKHTWPWGDIKYIEYIIDTEDL